MMTTKPIPLSPDEITLALQMYQDGAGIERIAKSLTAQFGMHRGKSIVYSTFKRLGIQMRAQGTPVGAKRGPYKVDAIRESPRDPATNYPIGQVPKWRLQIMTDAGWMDIPDPKSWGNDRHMVEVGGHRIRRLEHPLYKADQEMLRARTRKREPIIPWRQSSLVG